MRAQQTPKRQPLAQLAGTQVRLYWNVSILDHGFRHAYTPLLRAALK